MIVSMYSDHRINRVEMTRLLIRWSDESRRFLSFWCSDYRTPSIFYHVVCRCEANCHYQRVRNRQNSECGPCINVRRHRLATKTSVP